MNDLNSTREYYARLEDEKVIQIAKEDSKKLNDGVVEILKHEIKRRGLDASLLT